MFKKISLGLSARAPFVSSPPPLKCARAVECVNCSLRANLLERRCERHVDGGGCVSDSRDQNIVLGEREVVAAERGVVTRMILSLPCGYAAVIAGMTLAETREEKQKIPGKVILHVLLI